MLNDLLEDYTARVLSNSSALVRILGVFMLQVIDNFSVDLLIMENIAYGTGVPVFKFDLKGCTQDRADNRRGSSLKSNESFMKDLDFLTQVGSLKLETQEAVRFIETLQQDVDFLMKHEIMDYSLFGVYFEGSSSPKFNRYCYGLQDKPNCYYTLGVIDILQVYNARKVCEH
mmetsp:Transcript_18097/g.32378  ORF Transcript_18097/g.32378 Transcript_18097/m.32378 type:complete len:172 (-) Transcript_18097:99-614(-)